MSHFNKFWAIVTFPLSLSTHRCLVSKLFDVCPRSTLEEIVQQDEVRVAWGTGIAGHVAESGEPVNIPDAYQVNLCLFNKNSPLILTQF